jgi:hypothetical protein
MEFLRISLVFVEISLIFSVFSALYPFLFALGVEEKWGTGALFFGNNF